MNLIQKYICCIKPQEQSRRINNSTNMNYLNLPGQTTAANKPRAQVALAPRHGLMDWIRKMNSTPNISGTNGKFLNVTEEELAQHNKQDDCWIAIGGNVYNITPYLAYHPGGVDEIMRGAGIDATALFQEVHSWVNFNSMLEKCLVGRLITKSKAKEALTAKPKMLPTRLRFDFRQPDSKTLSLFIYTTCPTLTLEQVFVSIENSKTIYAHISIDNFIHTIAIELSDLVVPHNFSVRTSLDYSGQIEIALKKQIDQIWKSIGSFLPNHLSFCTLQEFEPRYFAATFVERKSVTHDTDWYTFSIPTSIFMSPAIGQHIRLRRLKNDIQIVKPYTIINQFEHEKESLSDHTVQFLIKHYPVGLMTPMLQELNIGDTIEMSSCEGKFDLLKVDRCQTLILIAAGTGLTPMIRILNYVIKTREINKTINLLMLFFNKTENDILCRHELETLSNKYKFILHHILSQPNATWKGETGHIRTELLKRLLPPSSQKTNDTDPFICVCGPTQFSNLTANLLKEYGYSDDQVHLFLG